MEHDDDDIDAEQLVLGDLLNHVLDKGVVITGSVTISIADIDLLVVNLRLLLASVETSLRHGIDHATRQLPAGASDTGDPRVSNGETSR
ncbi:MAG TPA: gas vesicle protein [Gemmatimonadaceae bacterium]|nr:gas vesicle protein [Gemmatimonadaceae bacterium]